MGPDQQGRQFGDGAPASEPQNPAAGQAPGPAPSPMAPAWQPHNNDPLMFGGMPGPLPTEPIIRPVKQGKGKLVAGLSIMSLLLLGGVAAAYQFLYVPNTPAAIFKTGMQRSGETLEKLVAEATDEPNLKAVEQSVVNGKVKIESDGSTYGGTLAMSNDLDTSDVDLAVNMTDQDGKKTNIGLELLLQVPEGKRLPDTYFKLQGIKELGLEQYIAGIDTYENQWVGISAEFLEELYPVEAEAAPAEEALSAADLAEVSRAVLGNVRTYVLTDDPAVAVLQQKRFVGTEQIGSDITANRYVVSVNKANAKKFCQSVINDVTATDGFKRLPGVTSETIDVDKRSAIEACNKEIDEMKDADTIELWIDTSYKLVSKVRFTEIDQPKSYVEFGQLYKGGDELPLFVSMHDEDERLDGRLDMVSNLRQGTTTIKVSYDARGESPFGMNLDLDVKPADKPVEVQKPATFTPLEDVLKRLGLDEAGPVLPTTTLPAVTEN